MAKIGDPKYTVKKNRRKRLRTIGEIVVILILLVILAFALFTFKQYIPYQKRTDVSYKGDHGFVALSYFGVARLGDEHLIAEDRLEEHLTALRNSGYVTITQKDVEEYYKHGKELPEKSLFLMFEDGRRDTAIFAQKTLEKLNYKATVMTYPEKFELRDVKFLMPKDLKSLEKTSYWELGTNGYRLAFINAFDRYGNYLGELSPLKHVQVTPYMGRKYNHYLMDYIRDEKDFPKESYNMMQDRVSYDYEKLRDVYTQEVGKVPAFHVLMHSNTGAFGNNREVSAVNERWITDLFTANFNREGFSWNNHESNVYDLTRMQPQSYWYSNHVLMRILHDQHLPVNFVRGRDEEDAKWEIVKGEPEYKEEKIVLTTEPNDKSRIFLRNMSPSKDLHISVRMTGNKSGEQTIYMRTNENLDDALAVKLLGDNLYVLENGQELFKLDLPEFDGVKPVSVEEDKKAAEVAELQTFVRYAPTKQHAEIYTKRLRDRESKPARSVEEGAAEYKPLIGLRDAQNREIEIFLKGHSLRLFVDGRDVGQDLRVAGNEMGKIALEAAWTDNSWSQRNLADDVYDGVFENLMVYDYKSGVPKDYLINTTIFDKEVKIGNPMADSEPELYSSKLTGWDGFKYFVKTWWEALLNLFINKM